MFYNFAVAPAGQKQQGNDNVQHSRAVFRACERCRLFRIKCGDKPCTSCRENNVQCHWQQGTTPSFAKQAPGSGSRRNRGSNLVNSTIPKSTAACRDGDSREMVRDAARLSSASTRAPSAGSSSSSSNANPSYHSLLDPSPAATPGNQIEDFSILDYSHGAGNDSHAESFALGHNETADQLGGSKARDEDMANSTSRRLMENVLSFFRGFDPCLVRDGGSPIPALPEPSILRATRAARPTSVEEASVGAALGRVNPAPTLPSSVRVTTDQRSYFVRLFWFSWGPLFPVMSEAEFQALYAADWNDLEARHTIEGALIDCMAAVGMQCGHAVGLGGRILGFGLNGNGKRGDDSSCDTDFVRQRRLECYTRCRSRVREVGSQVSLDTVRCYIMMTVYLLQDNQVESAYYMVGMGVRRAHSCNLHRESPAHLPYEKASSRARLWWLLCWLDLLCSMQLEKPMAMPRATMTYRAMTDYRRPGTPPSEVAFGLGTWKNFDPLTYFFHLSRLTVAISQAYEAAAGLNLLADTNADTQTILQQYAIKISHCMDDIKAWRAALPEPLSGPASSPDQTDHPRPIDATAILDPRMPDWLQRQCIVLSLHYSNACVLLQRPFIFSLQPLQGLFADFSVGVNREASPLASHYLSSAVEHATSMLDTLWDVYSKNDILDGLPELGQLLWNAIVTLMILRIVHPLHPRVQQTPRSITRALAILKSLSRTNSAALPVYQLVTSMASRLDVFDMSHCNSMDVTMPDVDMGLFLPPSDHGGDRVSPEGLSVAFTEPSERSLPILDKPMGVSTNGLPGFELDIDDLEIDQDSWF